MSRQGEADIAGGIVKNETIADNIEIECFIQFRSQLLDFIGQTCAIAAGRTDWLKIDAALINIIIIE
jgi:hypothetical protein